MRYQQYASFRKHLIEMRGQTPLRVYLIAVSDPAERVEAVREVLALWPPIEPVRVSSWPELSRALESPSLFGEETLVIAELVDKWSKKEQEKLSAHLQIDCGYLLLLAGGKASSLMSAVEKAGAVLDLTDEKPWDRERRLGQWLQERAARGGKRLSSDAAHLLLSEGERDLALFDLEIEKLIAYVGDRSTIERADVFQIGIWGRTATVWQIAEELVWEQKLRSLPDALVPFLVSVRTQLEMGEKLCSLSGSSLDAIKPFFPKVWPKTLERRINDARNLGPAYFDRARQALHRAELLSRGGTSSEEALITYLHTAFYAALSAAQRSG